MTKRVKLSAFLVANQLDIKGIKSFLDIKPLVDSSSELFYEFGPEKFQCFFNYGVIVFAGYSEDEMKWAIKAVQLYQRNPFTNWLRDDHEVCVQEGSNMIFNFDELILDKVDSKVFRITMFNLAQSVALDHYHSVTENLLDGIEKFCQPIGAHRKIKDQPQKHDAFFGPGLEYAKRNSRKHLHLRCARSGMGR